jgi:hypothetical protein
MRPDDLANLLHQRPFVPFRIHMTDGHSYDITHPDLVIVQRSYAVIGLHPQQETHVVDLAELCALIHIVRIEHLPPVVAGAATGGSD